MFPLPIRFTFGHRLLVALLCDSRKPSQTVHGVPQPDSKIGSTAIAFSLARLLSSFSETDGYDSPTAYGNNYSHGWTRPLLDLSAYAGQTVQLSFYLYTRDLVGGDDTGPGWYIDEVLVETGAYVYNNPEDWESGFDDWYVDYGTWEVGAPTTGPGSAYSGSGQCVATKLGSNYYDRVSSRLISPSFAVADTPEPLLRFRHWYSFSNGDYGQVQIRKIGDSAGWQTLEQYSGYIGMTEWSTLTRIELTDFAGEEVQLAFHLYSLDLVGGNDTGPGWFVDNIDVAIAQTDDPPIIVCPGSPFNRTLCEPGTEVCVPLVVHYEQTVDAGGAIWANDTLCFEADHFGSYDFTVIATNTYGADTCELTVNVTQHTPFELDVSNLEFAVFDTSSALPDPKMIHVLSSCGPGATDWSLNVPGDASWLSVDKTSGTNPDSVEISIVDNTLAPGIYTTILEFVDNAGSSDPAYVNITITLFVEAGVDIGDYAAEIGTSFSVPVDLYVTDALDDFTIPLEIGTRQPDHVRLDSVVVHPDFADSVILIFDPDSTHIVWRPTRPIQPPPLPDSVYELGQLYFTALSSAAPEVFYIDTVTTTIDEVSYTYEFVEADGDTIEPHFDRGRIAIDSDEGSLELGNVTCPQGGTVGVPVIATGIQDACGLQLQVSFDPDILVPAGDIVTSDYFTATKNVSDGVIYIAWANSSQSISVPDGDTLLTLWFAGIGDVEDTSALTWVQNNIVSDCQGSSTVGISYLNGSVVIGTSSGILAGSVEYYTLVASLDGVNVSLSGAATQVDTTVNGWFRFEGLSEGNYTVTPSCDDDAPGVDVTDAVTILRYLAGLVEFSPYQLIAADVNCDCRVSISDVVKILRYITKIEDLPCGNWAFVERSFAIDDANWCTAPGAISETLGSTSRTDLHFLGIRKGDVNGDCVGGESSAKVDYTDRELVTFEIGTANVSAREMITLPILISSDAIVAGLEMHIRYDPNMLALRGVSSDLVDGLIANARDDVINIAWADIEHPIESSNKSILAVLRFEALSEQSESASIEFVRTVVSDLEGKSYRVSVSDGAVYFDGLGALPRQFKLEQNYPNPFNPTTTICFSLPNGSDVRLDVYNIMGQRVATLVNEHLQAGEYSVTWDSRCADGQPVASGIYFYRIATEQFTTSRKMVLLK